MAEVGAPERLRLDPRSVAAGRVAGWTFTALAAVVLVGGPLYPLLASGAPLVSWVATGAIVATVLAAIALAAYIAPAWRYETTWLRIDDDGLQYGHGRWWQHHVSIPRARIQHTDVTHGPLERRFGLGTLVIYTAGTEHASITIEGLRHDTALALRDALLTRPADPAAAPSAPAPDADDAV